ncbi:multidrug effflux MFS transporter [Galactobacter valiniphilus]|uniref:multidrug effflux MFS transporter n=1 Tax=Galactobacter valiniphilus TaxID=2676122 RepID=UPI003735FDC9
MPTQPPAGQGPGTGPTPSRGPRRRDPSRGLGFAALAAFAAVSPLCTDIYTPAMPDVMREFGTTPSAVQLTLTSFMIGLAVGQLLFGTLSDALGRRRLLLIGGVVTVLASVACALAPSIEVFIAARAVQGFAGAAGVVLGRAIIADSTVEPRTGRLLGLLTVIVGIAPVAAPLLGAVLIQGTGWRGVFWAVAGVLALVTVVAAWRVPETLAPERRAGGGFRRIVAGIGTAMSRPLYRGLLVTFIFSFGAFFAYISASSFILREQHGMGALGFGASFAACALAMTATSLFSSRAAGRIPYGRLIGIGLGGLAVAASVLFVASLIGTPLWLFLPACALLTASMGLINPNLTALALGQVRDVAGTGSALLGTCQFGIAAAVAPLVGLAGEHSSVPFGVCVLVLGLGAGAVYLALARGRGERTTAVG